MTERDSIFVAGHKGLVGSALVRALAAKGRGNILVRTRQQLDLRNQAAVHRFFDSCRPDTVFIAAGKVGGIHANNVSRWQFLHDNLAIQTNILECCLELGVQNVVYFGSSCIYPRAARQPIREEYLLDGPLEPTNEPYAIAKIAGLKLVEAANFQYGHQWLSLMPTNLYGPADNFDPATSHVLPALIRKFHDATLARARGSLVAVRLWGTGEPLREFLHVDDMAEAACHLLDARCAGLYNVGSGDEVSIKELAELVAETVGYDGSIEWDSTMPNGTPRKLLDSGKTRATGWKPQVSLADGVRQAYRWYADNHVVTARAV